MKNWKILKTGVLLFGMVILGSCNKEEDKVCLNGGTNNSGTCECKTGYTGSDCGTEKTPVSMTVTSIKLNKHPNDDGGFYWDPFSGMPDIFLSINTGTTANNSPYTSTSEEVQDAHTPTYTVNALFEYINENYSIGLWDYDTADPNDYMGGINFKPSDYKSGFPSTINLKSGSIDMTLNVKWNF
jgi:hypothetical protein